LVWVMSKFISREDDHHEGNLWAAVHRDLNVCQSCGCGYDNDMLFRFRPYSLN
jgi:hypothetical protein